MPITNRWVWVLLLVMAVGISACSLSSVAHSTTALKSSSPSGTLAAIDLRKRTSFDELIPEIVNTQIVLVGESHTELAHHQNQLAVIKALHPHWKKMGIGLEFIQSPFQHVLDDYVSGKISEAEMLKQSEWYKRWKYDFRLYRDIFQYARQHRVPLFALNAPAELTRKIRESGIEGLEAKDRRSLPETILRSDSYRQRMMQVFQQHGGMSPKQLDNFIDVQLAWDESMAANAVKAIKSGRVDNMVLLAGSGHVIRQAIPVRLERSLATKPIIIVNNLPDDVGDVDFVLPVKSKDLPPSGKIGIMMQDAKQGVEISQVLKTHRFGLKKNDVIMAIDGHATIDTADIKILLLDKKPGDSVTMKILRGKSTKPIELTVKLH